MSAPSPTPLRRHFTATGFVVWRDAVLLHWHRKEHAWFPPGGHIEPNEDPVACVLREIEEESGIHAEVATVQPLLDFEHPTQLQPPVTILVERVGGTSDGHEHLDLIYYCRPLLPPPARFADTSMRWAGAAELELNAGMIPPGGTTPIRVPSDVRLLALDALRRLGTGAA